MGGVDDLEGRTALEHTVREVGQEVSVDVEDLREREERD